jgi:hypothetical protein
MADDETPKDEVKQAAGVKGGRARAEALSPDEKKAIAQAAARARWSKVKDVTAVTATAPSTSDVAAVGVVPKATHWGELQIGDKVLPCYRLDTDERVFSLKGVVVSLMGTEGGQLAEYIKVKSLRPYLPNELVPAENDQIPALIQFDTGGEGFTKYASGLPVERFIDICEAYSRASESGDTTERQDQIAQAANAFLRASAKVGIIALVDEATGYQEERPADELQFKLKLFLTEYMRKWEKTFPDELWQQFGRLTKWKGSLHQRPKYWGKLVMELIYEYLDPDVAQWLKENAPAPRHGQNYFQWLNEQYGLKKLVEHIWKVIGVASTCETMDELKQRMEEIYGKRPGFQFSLKLVPMAPASKPTA